MKLTQPALVAFALAALCIVGAVVLLAINKTVPEDLWTIAFASLTGGAGIAIPTPTTTSTTAAPAPPPRCLMWMPPRFWLFCSLSRRPSWRVA